MQNLEMLHRKKDLIDYYLLPSLAPALTQKSDLLARIEPVCQIHKVLKGQLLEQPGPFEKGMLWFSISALIHSYYYDEINKNACGTRIWKRRDLIFDDASFFEQQYRSDFIEVLEPGEVLSISYPDLRALISAVPEIMEQIKSCESQAEKYYRKRSLLLVKPAIQRVREFETDQSLFAKVASNSIKAMHIGLSRQSYELQLKLLRKFREG